MFLGHKRSLVIFYFLKIIFRRFSYLKRPFRMFKQERFPFHLIINKNDVTCYVIFLFVMKCIMFEVNFKGPKHGQKHKEIKKKDFFFGNSQKRTNHIIELYCLRLLRASLTNNLLQKQIFNVKIQVLFKI